MPLIDTASLLRIADRAAYQYGEMQTLFGAIQLQGTAFYWETVTATDDPDVEIPLLKKVQEVDDDLQSDYAMTNGTFLPNIIFGMEDHFNLKVSGVPLQVGGWDGYLTDNDERVSQYFAEMYYAIKGNYMLANNVFSEGDDKFADAEVAAGPVVTFTDGINYGNGSSLNLADGNNFAATQLRLKVVAMGGTDLDLRLSVKDKDDNPTTIDVTVSGGTAPGTYVSVGTSADRFLDVTGVDFAPAGSTGTVGDTVEVRNLKERQVAL